MRATFFFRTKIVIIIIIVIKVLHDNKLIQYDRTTSISRAFTHTHTQKKKKNGNPHTLTF